jgi:hypothetical protein
MKYKLTLIGFLVTFSLPGKTQVNAVQRIRSLEPVKLYTVTAHNLSLGVDANAGSRIVSVKVDGQELLGSSAIHPKYYGSSLWLSPEGKWRGGGVLDTAAYSVGTANSRQMSFTSQDDTLRGFNMKKEFRVSMPDTSVIVSYTLKNIRASQQDVAPLGSDKGAFKGPGFLPCRVTPAFA